MSNSRTKVQANGKRLLSHEEADFARNHRYSAGFHRQCVTCRGTSRHRLERIADGLSTPPIIGNLARYKELARGPLMLRCSIFHSVGGRESKIQP
jgi:hypothetical protein